MRYRMGDLVEQVTEVNSDLKYGLNDIVGVTLEKQMIPTIANLTQTNLDNFIIVHPKDFVYNPRTHGKKIGLGFNTTDRCFISTWNNNTFRVKPEMSDVIMPEYLYMYFLREKWDKEACFNAWGSSTVVLLWSSFCDMKINVPSLPEQRKIVHDYQVITDRIELLRKMNENLEQQAQIVFHSLFIDVDETNCTLADICNINPSRTLKKGEQAMCFEMATLPVSGSMPVGGEVKPYNGGTRFKNGDTLIARITPCFENGKAAYINMLNDNEVAFGSTEYIVFSSKGNIPSSFYYYLVRNKKFKDFGMQFMNGSSGRQRISGEEFGSFAMKKPSSADIERFAPIGEQTLMTIKRYSQEIALLLQVQSNIVSGIASLSKGA